MTTGRKPFADRFYAALLRLFPFDFRGEFESDMEQTFREQRADAQRSGKIGLLRLWWETLTGVFQTAPREHAAILNQDIRHALRMMRHNPGYTTVAVLTLALGIGANTALVSVIDAVLLRPLPYQQDKQLVVLHQNADRIGARNVGFSVPEMNDYRQRNHSLSTLVEYHSMRFTLLSKQEAARVRTGVVSPGFFKMLGVKPILGRDFVDADDQPNAPAVLLLSYEYWKQHCGDDPNIVGKTFEMNDRVHTAIGVLPPVPQYPQENDVYMPTTACPFRASPNWVNGRSVHALSLFGRLKPDVTLEQCHRDLQSIAADLEQKYPATYGTNAGFTATSGLLREELTEGARLPLLVLLGAAACVLLIACANVANLTLARMSARERELTVRAALGAGKGRLLRQLVTESFLMGVLAAVLGVGLASLSLRLLVDFTARLTSRAREIQMDGSMLLFALAVAFVTSIVFGSVSALSSRDNLTAGLKEGPPATTVGPRRKRARNALVVCQVAFSFVLLIGAGLMLRSLDRMQRVDPGFQTEHVLAVKLDLNWSKYQDDAPRRAFADRVLARVSAQPGVISAAMSSSFPLDPDTVDGGGWNERFSVEEHPPAPGEARPLAAVRVTTPDYFKTLGIRLLKGRTFRDSDTHDVAPVVVINETLARRHWADEDPVGKRIAVNNGQDMFTVIGVVADVKEFGPYHTTSGEEFYMPNSQNAAPGSLLVRTDGDPKIIAKEMRRAITEADPQVAIPIVVTLDQARIDSMASPRVMTNLLAIFASLALLIAAAGIGGMLALTVNQSMHEIGIRVALGAGPADVFGMVLGKGMSLVLVGLVIGIVSSLALTRLMRSLLFEVTPTDLVTFAAVSIVLAVAALVACYVPARRALKIDPLLALRRE